MGRSEISDGRSAVAPCEPLPFVSFIVPAYNEAAHLRECLESLCRQDYPRYEMILVDNGSTDETRAICEEFPEVRYVFFDQVKSSYAARNEGTRVANGEVLAFFDADQRAEPHYLRSLLSEYVQGDPNHIYVGNLADDLRVPRVLREFYPHYCLSKAVMDGNIATAAVAIPRDLFDRLGGFKVHLLSGADFEFFGRAVRVATVHVCEKPAATHYWARDVNEQLLREQRFAFAGCLRAHGCGKPCRSWLAITLDLTRLCFIKAAVGGLVPVRHPRHRWLTIWKAQWVGILIGVHRFIGIAKFKLGAQRAGDLPADAGYSMAKDTSTRASTVE